MSRYIKAQNSNVRFDKTINQFAIDEKQYSAMDWYRYLSFLVVGRFKWNNVPKEIYVPWIEETLFTYGSVCFFKEKINDNSVYMMMKYTPSKTYDIYNRPTHYNCYADNSKGYKKNFTNSVIVNESGNFEMQRLCMKYANILANNDAIIDVEHKKMKRPLIVTSAHSQVDTVRALLDSVNNGDTAVIGTNELDKIDVKSFNNDYKFQMLDISAWRQVIINEFLTMIGIDNNGFEKKERQVSAEVEIKNSLISTIRYNYLKTRQIACEEINNMFGTKISVEWSDEWNEEVKEDVKDTKE